MSVRVVDVDLLEISFPSLFGLSGKTYNRQIIVLTGPAGVGKTTLAHGMLHAALAGAPARKGRTDRASPRIEVVPIHLLLEFNRLHSVEHGGGACPLVRVVGASTTGVEASLAIGAADAAIKKKAAARGSVLMPVVVVDAATDLRGDDTDRIGNIWRGIQMFLSWLDEFTYYIAILVAQERANINAGPYAQRYRAGIPNSHLHSAHLLARIAFAGEEKLRIVTRTVNAIADKPQAEVILTMDTLRALITGGDTLRFGFEWAGKTRVYLEA